MNRIKAVLIDDWQEEKKWENMSFLRNLLVLCWNSWTYVPG